LLGTSVVVENRSGAGGGIGLRYVQSIQPQLANNTVLVSSTSTQSVLPLMEPAQVGFNPIEEMRPIALLGTYFLVVMVSKALGISSMEDLRRRAGERLAYGSPGTNSEGHLATVLLGRALGAKEWEHIPYRGGAPAASALMSDEVQLVLANSTTAPATAESGKALALAITADSKSSLFPDLPSVRETGTSYSHAGHFGLVGPKEMSPEAADAIAWATNTALAKPEVNQKLQGMGLLTRDPPLSPDAFLAFQRAERERFVPLVKDGAA
jgi:tripartite-type tricarboxylate transporter receptor subunit TctC